MHHHTDSCQFVFQMLFTRGWWDVRMEAMDRRCQVTFTLKLPCHAVFESVSCLLCTSLSYAVCAVFVGCPTFLAHLIPSFYNQ